MVSAPEINGTVKDTVYRKPAGMADTFYCRVPLWLFMTLCLVLCLMPETGHAQYRELEYSPQKIFRLTGEISLIYERDWVSGSRALSEISYYANLQLSGFVVDPRIMTFQAGGYFGQNFFNPGDNFTLYGVSLSTQLLNERPKRGPLQFFPQPIELRYSYGSGKDTEVQNYGVSLRYDFSILAKQPKVPVQQQQEANSSTNNQEGGKQKGPTLSIPGLFAWPIFYMDYDVYTYKYADQKSKTDHLSLRLESIRAHAEYLADYEDYTYHTGDVTAVLRYLDLQANYHLYDKDKMSNLDIYNRLLLSDNRNEKNLTFTSAAVWVKHLGPMGRDSVVLNGGGRYFTSSSGVNAYELNLTSSYNKFFSERFSNYASLGLGYGKEDDRTLHGEKLQNMLAYALTPYLRFDNTLWVGNTQDGPLYGFSAALTALTQKVTTTLSYQFSYQDVLTGNTKVNLVNLDLNGSLSSDFSFYSQNYYRVSDVEDIISPYQEKDLYLSANMMWRIFRCTVSLGASYLRTKTDLNTSLPGFSDGLAHNPSQVDTAIATYNATITALLARRMNLNLYAYYQQIKNGPDYFYLTPMLLWYYRKMTLDAEYTLRITKRPSGSSNTEHRVYLRLTRQIDNTLRPFW